MHHSNGKPEAVQARPDYLLLLLLLAVRVWSQMHGKGAPLQQQHQRRRRLAVLEMLMLPLLPHLLLCRQCSIAPHMCQARLSCKACLSLPGVRLCLRCPPPLLLLLVVVV
jgi:hypothetical protein